MEVDRPGVDPFVRLSSAAPVEVEEGPASGLCCPSGLSRDKTSMRQFLP